MEFIPLPTTEQTLFTVSPTLDGELFFITYDWNSVHDFWAMTIQDVSGTTIASGIRMVPGFPLLRNVNKAGRPKGEMFVYLSGFADVTEANIEECQLVYLEESELV